MSELMAPQLAPQNFPASNAIGDTGAQLRMSQIPPTAFGRPTYLRGMDLRVKGTITIAGGGSANMNFSQLLSAILLQVPGVAVFFNSVSGNKLARMYRVNNFGNVPAYGINGNGLNPWTVAAMNVNAGGANVVDVTFPIEFSNVGARRFDDRALPVALFQDAVFKVSFPRLTDINPDITGNTLVLTVTPRYFSKKEKKLGLLQIVDSTAVVGVQPPLNPWDGIVPQLFISPTSDGVFPAATDYTQLGASYGALKITEDATPVSVFYDQFNRYAQTAMPSHLSTRTDPTASLPLEFAPGGHQGQHNTYETIPAGLTPRMKTDVAVNAYSYTFAKLLSQNSPEAINACKLIGFPLPGSPNREPATASKKTTVSAAVQAVVPAKDPT